MKDIHTQTWQVFLTASKINMEKKKTSHTQMHHSKIVENYRQREKSQKELGKSAHYLQRSKNYSNN